MNEANSGLRLYVAGPMTGLPGYNLAAFVEASRALTTAGYLAINPGRRGADESCTWADYVRAGLRDLLGCQGVALLPGWEASKGAQLEVQVAAALGMSVRPVGEWLVGGAS